MIETSSETQTATAAHKISLFAQLQEKSVRWSPWLIGMLIFFIALAFNTHKLGAPSLWFDEVYSVQLVRHPFSQVWSIIFSWQPNMELYYLILYAWLHVLSFFGLAATEFAVRFPSAFFAALSAVVVFALGRRFINLEAGILGSLLYLLNPHELVYAQQTRAYGLQLFLLCLGWYLLFAAITSKKRWNRYWLGYAIVMILAIYTHLISGIMLMTQVLAIGSSLLIPHWRRSIWPHIPAFIASLVGIGLALLPLVPVVRHGDATGNWLGVPKLSDMYWIFEVITAGDKNYLRFTAASVVLGLFLVILSLIWRTSRGHALLDRAVEQEPVLDDLVANQYSGVVIWSTVCWLFLPVLLSYIISKTVTHIFSERYLVIIIPAFGLLVGLGAAGLRGRTVPLRSLQIIIALFLVLWSLQLAKSYYPGAQIEDWRSAAQWVMNRYQQDDGLVCYDNNQGCQVAMEYYFQTYPQSEAHFDADTPGVTRFWTPAYFANAGQAIDPTIVSTYATKYHRLFYITGRASEDQVKGIWQWLDQHYRLIGQMDTGAGISVRLYEVRP